MRVSLFSACEMRRSRRVGKGALSRAPPLFRPSRALMVARFALAPTLRSWPRYAGVLDQHQLRISSAGALQLPVAERDAVAGH